MIQFRCGHCGVRLGVPETRVGKENRCPKCKGRIVVPPASVKQPSAKEVVADESLDQQLLDPPKPSPTDKRSVEERVRELEAVAKLSFVPTP